MPQVASNPKVQAHNHQLPRLARPAQQPDRAPSPFETLLDDGAQAPKESAPPPPDDKAPRADNAQPARPAAKSNDGKTPVANDNTVTAEPDESGHTDKAENAGEGVDSKAAVDAKIAAAAADCAIKPAIDDKPSEGQKAEKPAVDAPAGDVQTTTTADAIAVVTTPTAPAVSEKVEHPAQLPEQAAPAAALATQSKPVDPGLLKAVVGKQGEAGEQVEAKKQPDTEEQGDADQVAGEAPDSATLDAKLEPQPHADGKPRATANESDKQHVAQARGEDSPNSRHTDSDAPAALPAQANATQKPTADAGPPIMVSTQPHAASNTAALAPLTSQQPGPQAAAIPLSGIAIEIAGKALVGKNRFEIRLDPPELGRIEVRLDVDHDGNVTSRLTVDRADTLDLLRRDAAGLERALQDAGLKTADNGLQFSLRDRSMNQQQASSGPDTAQVVVTDEPSADAALQNYGRLAWQGNGIDIRV